MHKSVLIPTHINPENLKLIEREISELYSSVSNHSSHRLLSLDRGVQKVVTLRSTEQWLIEFCIFGSEQLNRVDCKTLSCMAGLSSCCLKHHNFFDTSFFVTKMYKEFLVVPIHLYWKVEFTPSRTPRVIYFWIEQAMDFCSPRIGLLRVASNELSNKFGSRSCCNNFPHAWPFATGCYTDVLPV